MATTNVVPPQQQPARSSGGVVQFYHDVVAEMKRVTWPDRKQLQDSTIRIIVFVLLIGALIALLDIGLQFLLVRLPALLLGR